MNLVKVVEGADSEIGPNGIDGLSSVGDRKTRLDGRKKMTSVHKRSFESSLVSERPVHAALTASQGLCGGRGGRGCGARGL